MNFMTSLQNEINDRKVYTENGAVGYATSGKELLDLNFAVSSMRNWDSNKIQDKFFSAYYENPLYALKWLFFLRDIRGVGMGERRTFRICMEGLANKIPDVAKCVLNLISEYGRWDDLVYLINSNLRDDVVKIIDKQLEEDIDNCSNSKSISLLAKWLPSVNTSSHETKELANIICNSLKLKPSQYRKLLSRLRAYSNVVEVKMSANNWDEIDYSTVPSNANLLYSNAFLRNDEERRREYLASLVKGETKINSGTLFPSDIVAKYGKYFRGSDTTLEELWKALPDYVKEDGNTMVVRDGSGSMTVTIGNTRTSALDVSTALAIYFAEKSSGEFHDRFITFSANPKMIDMSNCKTLADKLNLCYKYSDCSNTNIEKVFDMILNAAINNHMNQEDMPKNILIVSDMEFDSMTYRNGYYGTDCGFNKTIFETFAKKFENNGYKLPRIIFWNVCSRTGAIPLKQNDLGVALVSGFSPAIYNMVLSNELDPYQCLIEQLNNKRYAPVEEAVKGVI